MKKQTETSLQIYIERGKGQDYLQMDLLQDDGGKAGILLNQSDLLGFISALNNAYLEIRSENLRKMKMN